MIKIKKVKSSSKKKLTRKTSSNKSTSKCSSQQSLQPGARGELTNSSIPGHRNAGPTTGRTS